DALNGEILDEQNLICNMDVIGTAVTKYSSTVTMTSDNYGTGQYRLRETGRGNGIETYNLKNSSSYTNTDFTNTSATWNVSGTDQAASDAHWGAEQTYDYYHNTFGRNSIDGAGYKLLSYVHYSTNYVNAYWDGQRMTYGDGNPSQGYNIMTALDVCGHEITHGLTSNTAKLGTGEAGALNEGFSDIFGTTIESFARPNQHDWLMGADLMTNGKGLRDMSNPKSLNQPDTYKGANWDASGEVHTNDGPCIFWYYLMCQGKSGTNDIGSAYNVTAIGMSDAAKIAYRALTVYFTSATTYATARTYAIQAATDLFGACSQQVITCTNAWYAVGVGTQFDPSACSNAPVSDFSADVTNSCTGVINFTDLSTFNPTSWSWDFGDGGTSTLKNPSHAYTSNGTFTVILVTSNANGTNTKTKTAYITVNMPSSPITVNDSSCAPGIVHLSASGANTLNWYTAATGGTLINTGTTYAPSLSVTTTYYVANEIPKPIQNVGEPDNSKGGGYYTATTDRRIVFDVLANMILKTVKVYANTAGSRVIEVVNSAGTQVAVKTVTLPAGLSTVTLDFNLTPGTGYGIKIATGSTVDLYRSSVSNGLPYPYTINNLVSIKTSDAATNPNNYYYFFYDWEVQEPACSSALIPVTGSIVVCSGVNSVSADNFFNVYPNPASNGFVNIQKTAGDENNLAIEILNVMGEKIYSATIDNKQGMFNKTIDVSSYASGLYFISLKGKKNNITKKLLIE
ncbi:MAG TPA: M4 family metallopeptidase, partial [Bacteroidia bacterium]